MQPTTALGADARDPFALRTARGVGMPIAGALYWTAIAVLAAAGDLGDRTLALAMFFGTGAVFPLGWALTRALGGDLMAKDPVLTPLGMTLNFVQFAYWPAIVAVFFAATPLVPLLMGTLLGSHFIPYGWLYRSRGYLVIGIGSVLAATAAHVLAPAQAFIAIPAALACVYAAGIAIVLGENRRLRMAAVG